MENIFIDTSIFEGNNFLESARINEILRLSEEGRIRIVLPRITYQEIINRATINIKASISRFKKSRDETKILRNIQSIKDRFELLSEETCLKDFFELFTARLTRAKCEIIEYPTVNIREVFDKYFNDQFPFSKGEKKHEFPDAFALLSVETWCKENKCKCYVFSNDKDLLQYKSKYLIIVESYEKFLDSKLRRIEVEKKRKERIKDIEKLFEKNKSILENEISEWVYEQIGDESVFYSGVDIHEVDVSRCEVDLSEFQIVSITDDNIQLETKARLFYRIEVEVDDESTGWYNDDDKEWYYTDTEVKTIDQDQVIFVSLHAHTPLAGKQYLSIEIDEINRGKDLRISI